MDAPQQEVARKCLAASYEGTMDFPSIVRSLMDAGFEAYHVDFRAGRTTYYGENNTVVEVPNPHTSGTVSEDFHADVVARNVRWAQSAAMDYTYGQFCKNVQSAGCAGYFVSFPGRRVVYYGRTAETHVEHFPT